jgi:large subunit ribosomal protein L25
MHEKSPVLSAKARDRVGTRYADRVRKAGGMPINLYGKGQTPIAASVDAHEFLAHINKGEKIFRVNLDGVMKEQVVLLTGIQFDWMGNNPVHADLARVSLTDRVKTRVPLHLIGEAAGLKQAGAILLHPTNELEVECIVTEIPDFIEVNIGTLDVGHAITVSEVKLPSASIKVLTDKNHIVAQIIIQQETVVAEATAATAGPAEPEVLTAKKPAEGEAAAGAKPAAGKDAKAPAAPKK